MFLAAVLPAQPSALVADRLLAVVYVLFNHNKIVLWIMSVLFVAEIAIMASAIGVTVPAATFNENCQILWTPSYFMAYWYVVSDEI